MAAHTSTKPDPERPNPPPDSPMLTECPRASAR